MAILPFAPTQINKTVHTHKNINIFIKNNNNNLITVCKSVYRFLHFQVSAFKPVLMFGVFLSIWKNAPFLVFAMQSDKKTFWSVKR